MAAGAIGGSLPAIASARPAGDAENYVKRFHETLTEKQRQIMHFPFDHELRSRISNNWHIVDAEVGAIGKLYTADQQELIRSIFRNVVTEDGWERYQRQMKDDDGGIENYTCALFGKPGEERFEWVLTGRHVTIRADGNSVDNAAFGGPIFYGHAVKFNEEPDHPGNVWWHQSRLANQIFEALDGKQREKALLKDAPEDAASTVHLRGSQGNIPGLRGSELSRDQKELLEKTLRSMLSMFRESDVSEALECIKKNGGLDKLAISYYQEGDLGSDGIWDRWRVEGPAFVWYFRGSPHVHVWVNVGHEAESDRQRRRRVRF